jgi:hypothetical protein
MGRQQETASPWFRRSKTMYHNDSLTTFDVRFIFAEEVAALGGTVSQTFDDGVRLFARSVLPGTFEIKRGDAVQGGVAVKATDQGVWVHPYLFRLICTNGAIWARALQTHEIADLNRLNSEVAEEELREAIRACAAPEAFAQATGQMRSATTREADTLLRNLSLLTRLSHVGDQRIATMVLRQYFADGDRSVYGLMNAVTAVARDTPDPEIKWRLEEFGGGIPSDDPDPMPVLDGGAARSLLEYALRERELARV